MIYVGVDVGSARGGIGIIKASHAKLCPAYVFDLPTAKPGRFNQVDSIALYQLLIREVGALGGRIHESDQRQGVTYLVEQQQAWPKQGSSSNFYLGDAFGVIRGLAGPLGWKILLPRPQVWKKAMGLTKDKGMTGPQKAAAVLLKAREMFPDLRDELAGNKDEHKAEALLIAEYGRINEL